MKITCTKCGKRFDAEDHLYICPKCNHYHSQTGKHGSVNVLDVIDELIPDDTLDEEPEFIKTVDGEQTIYTARRNDMEENKSFFSKGITFRKIRLAVCIIVGFIMIISSNIGEFDEWGESGSGDSDWGYTYTEEMEVDFGDPMDFETFTVNINEVCEPQVDGLKADDGFKLVQINFNTESSYEYESWDISTEVSLELYNGEQYDYPQDVYYALYKDEVSSDRPVEEEMKDAGLVAEAHYSGEYFWIFEIPEDVSNVKLNITSYTADDEDGWSYTQDECIKMPVEL